MTPILETGAVAAGTTTAALALLGWARERHAAAQRAFCHRARCNGLAACGAYTDAEEKHAHGALAPDLLRHWHDD